MELTPERIAEWHPDYKYKKEFGGWYKGVKWCPTLPRWLDPDSNDWVELLEATRDKNIRVEVERNCDTEVCSVRLDSTNWVARKSYRESFLAALAQLIEAKEGE